jgi:hypothetical protein
MFQRENVMRRWIAGICLGLAVASCAAQARDEEVAKANDLYKAGKRVEALPLYEDLAQPGAKEWVLFERLADCLGAKAAQLTDPAKIKALRIRERDAAKHAIELGDPNYVVKMMAQIDPDQPLFGSISSPGKPFLAEAEKAFAAGDFSTAMAKYAAAADADPKLYEAPLYAGDTAYTQQDLSTAAKWFARAVAVDPNRETAYRYWGDAILRFGNDPAAAREKYIDAILAEPYNKIAWEGITQWAKIQKVDVMTPKIDRPAAPVRDPKDPKGVTINVDPKTADQPGGAAWLGYSAVRAQWNTEKFSKAYPNEKEYRHSLREEDEALSSVAAIASESKTDPAKMDESLRNLLELKKAGMLDCWILISGADHGITLDYAAYRKEHRQLLHDYVTNVMIQSGSPSH